MPASVSDQYAEIARRVSQLPIWIFHGDVDQTVPVDVSRRMAAALKAIGADVQYTELPVARFDQECRRPAASGQHVVSTGFGMVSVEDLVRFSALHARHHCKQMP